MRTNQAPKLVVITKGYAERLSAKASDYSSISSLNRTKSHAFGEKMPQSVQLLVLSNPKQVLTFPVRTTNETKSEQQQLNKLQHFQLLVLAYLDAFDSS